MIPQKFPENIDRIPRKQLMIFLGISNTQFCRDLKNLRKILSHAPEWGNEANDRCFNKFEVEALFVYRQLAQWGQKYASRNIIQELNNRGYNIPEKPSESRQSRKSGEHPQHEYQWDNTKEKEFIDNLFR